MNLVLRIAELAGPRLLVALLDNCARAIEDCLARGTEVGITSRQLSPILKALEAHLENVGVEFNFDALTLRLLRRSATAEISTLCGAFVFITQVQITVELIRIHLFR